MGTTHEAYESEISLRPTPGHVFIMLLCVVLPIAFSLLMLSHIMGGAPNSKKTPLVVVDVIFFVFSVYSTNSGIRGMLNGKIRIDGKGLTVKQRGKTKFSSFDDISKIVLTKTLSGKTWVQLVVISLSDFKKIYIYDHYDKTAEEIFDFLNNDMEIKKSRIAFAVQPAFSIT